MSFPEWVDETLSKELPVLRDRGEGQSLEFMAIYPENGYELSREIAAFASCNGGLILIGVSDDGNLMGLQDLDSVEGRDRLLRRIEGVCSGNVRPSITPVVKFGQESEAVVLAIEVPRGNQPIYYSKFTPYIRHLSRSRPAEPHEVIELVAQWSARTSDMEGEDSEKSQYLSEIISTVVDVLIDGEELEDRRVNPWLEDIRSQFAAGAMQLRELAAHEQGVELGFSTQLQCLAESLDAAALLRLTLGRDSWERLRSLVGAALEEAKRLKSEIADMAPLSQAAKRDLNDLALRSSRKLADLNTRADEMTRAGRTSEVQEEASLIGRDLLEIAHYLATVQENLVHSDLWSIGRELHLLETERLYLDGGRSVERIVKKVQGLNDRLQALDFRV